MRVELAPKAVKSYVEASPGVQKAFDKQTNLLIGNLRHPSLHVKKYDESQDIW